MSKISIKDWVIIILSGVLIFSLLFKNGTPDINIADEWRKKYELEQLKVDSLLHKNDSLNLKMHTFIQLNDSLTQSNAKLINDKNKLQSSLNNFNIAKSIGEGVSILNSNLENEKTEK